MEAHLTLEPEVLDAGAKPPAWLEPLPLPYRRRRAFLALAIGVTIATWMAYLQWSNNVLGQVESIWLIVALAIGCWRFKVWMNKGPVRRYQSNVSAAFGRATRAQGMAPVARRIRWLSSHSWGALV